MEKNTKGLISLTWIKLNRWCDLTGDTPDAVHARRKTGKWTDNIHCKVHDGKLWINVIEAQTWVDYGNKKYPEAYR
jgi:hypothetical protein